MELGCTEDNKKNNERRTVGRRKIMQLIIPKPPGQKADPMSSQKIVHRQTNINSF